LPAKVVVYGVLQDALEQHRQFGRRLGGVFFGQFEHCVLHDVERGILVLDREYRLLERATLHFGEKRRDFLVGGQFSLPRTESSMDYKHTAVGEKRPSDPESVDENRVSLYCLSVGSGIGPIRALQSAVRVPSGGATSASGNPFGTRPALI
jgi:hypothetical protein